MAVCLQERNSEAQPEVESGADNPEFERSSLKNLNIVRSSKFRHIEGKHMHQSSQITKIPSLSSTVPGDSNGFQVDCNCPVSTHLTVMTDVCRPTVIVLQLF